MPQDLWIQWFRLRIHLNSVTSLHVNFTLIKNIALVLVKRWKSDNVISQMSFIAKSKPESFGLNGLKAQHVPIPQYMSYFFPVAHSAGTLAFSRCFESMGILLSHPKAFTFSISLLEQT